MLRSLPALAALTFFITTTPTLAKEHHRPPSAAQCTEQKLEATGEKIEDKLQCAAKARKKGGPVSQDCLEKAEEEFNEDFAKAGDNCPGNAGAIEDVVDSCVNILSEDVPDSGKCASKSLDAIAEAAEAIARCLDNPESAFRANHRDGEHHDNKGKDDKDNKGKNKDKGDNNDDDDETRDGDGRHEGGEHDTQSECIAKAEADLDRALAKAGSCADSDVKDDLEACAAAIDAGISGNTTTTSSTSTSSTAVTVTTSSSTTSTTLASSCGNAILDPGEDCDPPGSITCPAGSPAGAFQACNSDCTCPGASTTTTTSTSTTSSTAVTVTTTSSSTTSSTIATSSCGNAIVDPGEDCDPPGGFSCPDPSSPGGALLACNNDCTCPGASTTTTSSSTSTSTTAVTVTTSSTTTSSTTEPSVTTTTSTSTTSTTLASSCGNAIVDPGEACDPPGSLSCPDPSSPGGAFLACNGDCTCPGASTTTTTSTSSTTSSTAIGSTTTSSSTSSSSVSTTSSSSTSTTAPTVTTSSSTTSTVTTSSTTTSTAPVTTTTSSSTTTSTVASTCCSAERITLNSAAGTLKVGGFAPFPFPPGVSTVIDAGTPDATCKHPVTVPAGGFSVPAFCIPALQYTSSVQTTGCESGTGDGAGFLWDGHTTESGGTPMTNVSKKADSSDGVCDNTGVACANRDENFLGDVDEVITAGGDGTKIATQLDIPAHSRTWQDAAGCPGDGVYNPADGDTLVTEFDFILSPTTGQATGQFADKNADGCALPTGSAGFGAPTPSGPATATGSEADGPCCVAGQSTTVATVGEAFSNSFPLYDLGFINVVPSTVQSCGAFVGDTCTVTSDTCKF